MSPALSLFLKVKGGGKPKGQRGNAGPKIFRYGA
jgi:hypothetical protein